MAKALSLAALTDVLAGAPQAYVGISTRRGPHVTPELFAVTGDRIVCMTAADTIKSRRLRRARTVACTIRNGARSVSMVGKATVIDAASPATLLQDPRRTATASMDAALFTVGNLAELSGAALDLVTGRLGGPIPQRRVVIVIEPHAAAITDGAAITYHAGWGDPESSTPQSDPSSDGPGVPDLGSLPDELAALAAESSETVVGWTREDGAPLTLPAAWDPRRAVASVPADLFRLVGAATHSPACVTFDSWSGYGPSGKQGLMLRGAGAGAVHGADVDLSCTFDRVTHWDGADTGSVDL